MALRTERDITRLLAGFLCLVLLTSCASQTLVADSYISQDEWMKAVLEYRKLAANYPRDTEYKSRLKQTELKAAEYYYKRGMEVFEQNNFDGALAQFQQGLAAMPGNGKLLQATRQVLLRKEANSFYTEAMRAKEAGQLDKSRSLLKRALKAYPDFVLAEEMLAHVSVQGEEEDSGDRLKVSSRSPITLNFRQTDIRTAFEFIAKSFGIDVVFDEGVRTMPVTLFAKDVTFKEALNLILATTKTFYKTVGDNSILIAPDSKEKRGQYEDQMVRVFQLTNIHAKEMSEILKGIIPLKKIIVNTDLNTIVVRDTEEAIKVAEKVVSINDRRPAELILEVEILEVNRSKAERLGLDLGTYNLTASIPSSVTIPLAGSIRNAVRDAAILTLPSAAFNFYKQDVDAKTLANPRLRVLSGKNAKIHIGDRVPLRAATVQDATGQVRTTYDYKEIGIRLTAEPVIHLDNSVTVKVELEVSSLGQNIGTQTEPAYSIGTRNAETHMLLRDGETAILGGLIRDEDRKTRVKVPLLGDVPVLGYAFTSADDSSGRTDVLLTITPRVVRGWDLPGRDSQMFVSGSEDRFSTLPLFGEFSDEKNTSAFNSRAKPSVENDDSTPGGSLMGNPPPVSTGISPPSALEATTNPSSATVVGLKPLVGFSEAVYEGRVGNEIAVQLAAENFIAVAGLTTEVLYNRQYLKYVGNGPGTIKAKSSKVEADKAQGSLSINLQYPDDAPAQGNGVLVGLTLRAVKPGTSYILYRETTLSGLNQGIEAVQMRASRIVIK